MSKLFQVREAAKIVAALEEEALSTLAFAGPEDEDDPEPEPDSEPDDSYR